MPASKYELRNGSGTRFVFPEVAVDDVRNNVSGGGSSTTSTTTLPGSSGTVTCGAGTSPSECDTALDDCEDALAAQGGAYNDLLEEYNEVLDALDEACGQAPLAGSWSYGRTVYRIANSGTCSGYAHFQREQYSASLAKNITFQGNTVGNGYRIINNPSLTALYRVVNTYIGDPNYRRVVAVRADQIRDDGGSNCMSGGGSIVLAKVDPAYPGGYGPQQGGIGAGVGGIGTYGVFARTNDTIDGTGPWFPDGPQQVSGSTLIGTITKAGEADVFDYSNESSNPCGDQAPPFYTVNYVAGTGGTISGITEQYIEPGGTGVAVTAVADSGFTFVSWSDGSTTAARPADSNPTSNGSLTANFIVTP